MRVDRQELQPAGIDTRKCVGGGGGVLIVLFLWSAKHYFTHFRHVFLLGGGGTGPDASFHCYASGCNPHHGLTEVFSDS